MNKEKEIINNFLSQLPGSCQHINDFFESDAEIIDFGSKQMLFTTDEFSGEDMFRDDDPHILGWNMAVCTISDILASGGTPKFYAHSVQVATNKWNDEYIKLFSKGIADVLNLSGAAFIGGDLGMSKIWHYTGICLGEADNSITRKGAEPGDLIYITGKTGAGNLEAALMLYSDKKFISKIIKRYKTYFKLRLDESVVIKEYANCCIDTSDGVLNALNTIAEINEVGYEVKNLPYLNEGVIACNLLSKPKTLLFMGECGEYELLFTIRKKDEEEFLNQTSARKVQVNRIGEITGDSRKVLFEGKEKIRFDNFDISARDFEDVRDYLNELTKYLSP